MVEQRTENPRVVSSILTLATILLSRFCRSLQDWFLVLANNYTVFVPFPQSPPVVHRRPMAATVTRRDRRTPPEICTQFVPKRSDGKWLEKNASQRLLIVNLAATALEEPITVQRITSLFMR